MEISSDQTRKHVEIGDDSIAKAIRKDTKEVSGSWAVDKRGNLATGINLVQLIAMIWFGASFFTQDPVACSAPATP